MIQKEKLILLRKEKRLTQMQVAEEIKVSRQAVSGWETGTVVPSIENLKSLSILYGVPVDHLLNEEINEENERISGGITNKNEQKVHLHKEKKRKKHRKSSEFVVVLYNKYEVVDGKLIASINETNPLFICIGKISKEDALNLIFSYFR